MADTPSTPPIPPGQRRRADPVNVQKFVATFVLITFLGLIGLLCWHVVPTENRDTLEIVVGVIGGSYKDIINYFFGSSSSSQTKDATISALAATPASGTAGAPS